jgi:hypothetical protein
VYYNKCHGRNIITAEARADEEILGYVRESYRFKLI